MQDITAEWQFHSIYIQAKEAGETGTFGSTTINYNKISFVLGSSPVDGGTGTSSFVDTGDGNWRATINYDVTGNDATTVQDVVDAINDHGDLSQIVEAFYKTPDGETAAVKLSGGTSVSGSYTIDDEDTTDTLDAHTLILQVRAGTDGVYTDATDGGVDIEGTYGDLSINSAGVWTYTLDDADADTAALTDDATETFQIRVEDDGGLTSKVETLTITIDVV